MLKTFCRDIERLNRVVDIVTNFEKFIDEQEDDFLIRLDLNLNVIYGVLIVLLGRGVE